MRLTGRRATSFPGLVALRLSPSLLGRLGRQLKKCIVVTGTNGKTTASRLLAAILAAQDPQEPPDAWIHNAEGANLAQGVVSALLEHTDWRGRLQWTRAVLEIDEATLPRVAHDLPVQWVVVTNVFRDQLDRYGELDTTVRKILEGIRDMQATVLLNADDPLSRYIGLTAGRPAVYYGMERGMAKPPERETMRDGTLCLRCGRPLRYEGFFYGQLGVYECPACGFARPSPDFMGEYDGASLRVTGGGAPARFQLPVRGVFNAYNALAAIAMARLQGVPDSAVEEALRRYRGPLGRMQVYGTDPASVLNLVKNPAGCDTVLETLCGEDVDKVLCIAINDLAADGRDVSWLWDADFERIPERGRAVLCVTTGLRAEDMALRLKYAGYPTGRLEVVPDPDAALDRSLEAARAHGVPVVHVLATYTALYPMAEALRRRAAAAEPAPARAAREGERP
ncbi:MAG: DUF1727 domain-containing protein [Firmicutes bacterium]|nr:DUF1727 domain-containing protein [Bacillota bacterium]